MDIKKLMMERFDTLFMQSKTAMDILLRLKYNTKSIGPRMKPCVTPELNENDPDFSQVTVTQNGK